MAENITYTEPDESIVIEGRRVAFFDFIRVLPSAPGKKDGFIGKVKGWWMDGDRITAIDVWGGKPQHERMRSFRPERCEVLSARKQNELQRQAAKAEVE